MPAARRSAAEMTVWMARPPIVTSAALPDSWRDVPGRATGEGFEPRASQSRCCAARRLRRGGAAPAARDVEVLAGLGRERLEAAQQLGVAVDVAVEVRVLARGG